MKKIPLLILPFLFAAFSLGQAGEAIHYMTEENPPYNFEADGKLQGIAVDLLVAIGKQAGHEVQAADIEMLPWPRAYRAVETQPGTALFSMARTEEREPLFKWVGPIMDLNLGLVAPKAKGLKIESVKDLDGLLIGSILDGAPEQLLVKAGFDAAKLERVPKPEQNVKKLAAGRIDAIAFNVDSTRYTMKGLDINPDDYETVLVLKKAQLYYAFHRDTDDVFIAAMNAALARLKTADSGGASPYDKILSSYLGGM